MFIGENSAWAQTQTTPEPVKPYVFENDLRTLPPPPTETRKAHRPGTKRDFEATPFRPGPPDPLWHPRERPRTLAPTFDRLAAGVTPSEFLTPSPNFDSDEPGDGPPDANGAVGLNHYIQIVNFRFEVFDKNGNRLAGPTDPQALWSGAPADDDCRVRGRGNPYVLYDHLADRWIITQFANHLTNAGDPLAVQCIAVSKGPNPVTGGFFAYTFQLGVKNDYPKLAVWPDGYYMISQRDDYDSTTNNLDAWVFDRANMLNGNPATFQQQNSVFQNHHDIIALPSDLTGPPPSNDGVAPHPKVFPGIRVVGRLATDPPGEMTTPEVHLADGGAASAGRWGDYSAMRVDPTNGCTFWYTTEYNNGTTGQQTHVGAVSFPTCNPADLAITKTAPGSVVAGGQLTYSFTVTNNGPSDATNVVVTDALAGGTTFLTSSIPCTAAATCTIGNLANGASISFTITVSVSAGLLSNLGASATNITNTATVTAHQFDPHPSNNTATASTLVTESADMALTKTCKPDAPAQAGTSAFCDIQVANLGVSNAQNVVVTDAIVSNASFTVTSETGAGASCTISIGSPTSATVKCNLLTVVAGGETTIHVAFTSNDPGDINDTATVRSTTPDPVSGNNSATGRVSFFASADLAISKTVTPPNPVVAGTNITYSIAVSNAGPSSASNVVVKDTLPAEVNVLAVTPSVGSCTWGIPGNPLQPLTCTIGSMASAHSATVTVVARVDPRTPNGRVVNNNATISSAATDPNNGNNSATAAVTVIAQCPCPPACCNKARKCREHEPDDCDERSNRKDEER